MYVTAYLIVVLCAFGAAMAGTVWAVVLFYKRYKINLFPILVFSVLSREKHRGRELDHLRKTL